MSYIQPISGNQFYGAIENTLVNNRAIYQASQGKGHLSVLRQVTGTVTIPTATAAITALAYLPILEEDGVTQVTVPFRSIVDNVEYSAIPFGGIESGLNALTVQAYTSTTPYTTTVYTAGSSLSSNSTNFSQVNGNFLATAASTGRASASGIYAVVGFGGAVFTTTQVNKLRVTVYYYSGQDLNN